MIELQHAIKPDLVVRMLNLYKADPCPVIDAGHGSLHFLIQPDHPHPGAIVAAASINTPHPLLAG